MVDMPVIESPSDQHPLSLLISRVCDFFVFASVLHDFLYTSYTRDRIASSIITLVSIVQYELPNTPSVLSYPRFATKSRIVPYDEGADLCTFKACAVCGTISVVKFVDMG